MLPISTALAITKGETRCHTYFADALTFLALGYQSLCREIGLAPQPDPFLSAMACRAGNCVLSLQAYGLVKVALEGGSVEEIGFRLDPKSDRPEPGPSMGARNAYGMTGLNERVIGALFSVFSEQAVDWIYQNRTTDRDNFPPVANFCRVVRNALAHGGTINIKSPKSPVVSWRGLTYSHADFGKAIINTGDLSLGDLFLLMIELEMELDGLGAPFDLG